MVLIQLLLPYGSSNDDDISTTRGELIREFGGLTAYVQTPAQGVWTSPEGGREQDQVVMIEVVSRRFDRGWWGPYSQRLRHRFAQDAIHVRALSIELLDEDSA